MENTNQQQDHYDSFFSDGIDWASIPLPDARPDQVIVEANRNVGVTNNTIAEDVDLVSYKSMAASSTLRSRIEGVGRLEGSLGETLVSNVGNNVGVESGGNPDCAVGNNSGDIDGRYVSRSLTGLGGQAEQQSPLTELRNQLEGLQKILTQKDIALFDLESTVVALEVETASRIKKSEHDSANKVKATQDELRRMQQELDSKNLALVKSRKRRKEEERQQQQGQKMRWQSGSNAADEDISTVTEINSNTMRSPFERRMQPQSVEIRTTPTSTSRMPTALSSLRHRIDTTSSHDISTDAAVSTLTPTNAPTPTSIAESNDTMIQETNTVSFQIRHGRTEILIDTNGRTQKIAAHLLLHCDNANTSTIPSLPKPHQHWYQQQHQYAQMEWDECKEDKCRIRTLLESMAIPTLTPIQPIGITAKRESISGMAEGVNSDKISPGFGMKHFARELICMFVAKFPPYPLTETTTAAVVDGDADTNANDAVSHKDDNTEQSTPNPILPCFHHHRGTVSWSSVEWILFILHQICSQSTEAKSTVRLWICQSCSNSDPPTVESTYKTTGDSVNHHSDSNKEEKMSNGEDVLSSSFASPLRVLSRIRGISSKQIKSRIVAATVNMNDVFATGRGGENMELCNVRDIIWDVQHKNMFCGKFFKLLSSLIIGKNKHQWGEIFPSSASSSFECQKIPTLVQIKSMALLHVLLNGCPQEIDNTGTYSPKNMWVLCIEHLMLPWSANHCSLMYECGNNNKSESSTTFFWIDLISAIEIQSTIPGTRPVGRRLYLKWIEGKESVYEGRENNSQKETSDTKTKQQKNNPNMGADTFPSNNRKKYSDTHQSFVNECSDLSTKCGAIQLLDKLICSSSHVRHLLFDNTLYRENPNFRMGVNGVKRILASILDDLQGFIIPNLSKSTYLICNDGYTLDERALIESILSLCMNETRLMAILCESVPGFVMMRTQMKVRSQGEEGSDMTENGDSETGVAVIVDVLECCVRVIIHNCPIEETSRNELSHLWSSIVNNTLSFLHLISCHSQESEFRVNTKLKDKHNHTSFASIIAGVNRKNALCSSCIMIADSEVISGYCCFEDGTLHQARLILNDMVEVD